jgi:branched-chain amino acid aminotransferase
MGISCDVRPVSVQELREADEVFISTSAGGLVPVTRLDGRIIGNDKEGSITSRLREQYWAKRKAGWHGTPIDYDPASSVSSL